MDQLEEKSDTQAEVGKRVKEIRKFLGLTQKEVAQKIGIGNSYISGIEKGFKNPKFNFFFRLALRFNISMDYLFFGIEPMRIDDKIESKKDERKYINEIITPEDLLWFMNHSILFRDTMMGYASKFHLDNEEIIKQNIENFLKRKAKIEEGEKGTG